MGGQYRVLGDGARKGSSIFPSAATLAVGALLIVLLTIFGAGRMFTGIDIIQSHVSYYQTSVSTGETQLNAVSETFVDTEENHQERDTGVVEGANCEEHAIFEIFSTKDMTFDRYHAFLASDWIAVVND